MYGARWVVAIGREGHFSEVLEVILGFGLLAAQRSFILVIGRELGRPRYGCLDFDLVIRDG
jgi:hypothetical protein